MHSHFGSIERRSSGYAWSAGDAVRHRIDRLEKAIRTLLVGMSAACLAACANIHIPDWKAEAQVDRIKDGVSCRVTPMGAAIRAERETVYVPYVELRPDQVRVGILSLGLGQLPPGRAMLRVDENPPWTIETSETPVDFSKWNNRYMDQNTADVTATTGRKAQALLTQMRSGREIRYQHSGLVGRPEDSTGTEKLGPDFNDAVAKCEQLVGRKASEQSGPSTVG